MRSSLLALALISTALPALAQEVNVYSHRQPELIQPLMDAFTQETGIKTNVLFLDKGLVERITAESAFKANVAVLKTADEMYGSLLDILA